MLPPTKKMKASKNTRDERVGSIKSERMTMICVERGILAFFIFFSSFLLSPSSGRSKATYTNEAERGEEKSRIEHRNRLSLSSNLHFYSVFFFSIRCLAADDANERKKIICVVVINVKCIQANNWMDKFDRSRGERCVGDDDEFDRHFHTELVMNFTLVFIHRDHIFIQLV